MFLTDCKKCDIIPNTLRLRNPFKSQTIALFNKGCHICDQAGRLAIKAAINNAYRKQRLLQQVICTSQLNLQQQSPHTYKETARQLDIYCNMQKKIFVEHKVNKFYNLCKNNPNLEHSASFLLKSSTSVPHKINHHAYSTKHSNVADLSDFKLSHEHHKFLQSGLSFSPTPKFADPVKICHDNKQFCRYLHEYFLSNGDANKPPVYNHRCKTCWTPPNGRNTFIDSFVNYTRDQYNDFISNTPHNIKPNLPKQQQQALRELSNNTNIVIKEADKGSGITIINKEDYVHDCNLILTDNSTYLKTTSDMVETHNEEAEDIIGNISSNMLHISQLFPVKATPGTFYALPKLHKLSHLISTKTTRHMTNGNLINTTQLIKQS